MSDAPHDQPLARSLDLVAEEIAELVQLGQTVQAVIAHLAEGSDRLAQVMEDAQASDLLTQRLEGLVQFVQSLADAERREISPDMEAAVSELTLAEQARRLRGAAPVLAAQPAGEAAFWD